MSKYTYDDKVKIMKNAPPELRPGSIAWIIAVFEENQRPGSAFDRFPPGVVYTVEFENGEAIDIHESELEKID